MKGTPQFIATHCPTLTWNEPPGYTEMWRWIKSILLKDTSRAMKIGLCGRSVPQSRKCKSHRNSYRVCSYQELASGHDEEAGKFL